jgi:drug/metabolite transporter (DMT)-like permease
MPGPDASRPAINSAMSSLEWAMLLALSVLWGGSFFFVGVAVKELPLFTIVVLRVGLAAVALHIIVRAAGVRVPTDRRAWRTFVGSGVLNNVVPFSLIVFAQTHIASGVASILNATSPLFVVIVAHFLTRDEKLTKGRLAGVIVGFAGVAVMIGGDALGALGTGLLAQLASLAAALFYAFGGVYGRRFRTLGIPPLAAATGQLTASSIILIPVMLAVDRPWTLAMPSAATVAAVLGLALLATALAYLLYFRILATAGATNLLLVTFLIPVTAIVLGIAVLGERLEPRHLAGMALIALGLAAIDGRPARALARLAAAPPR